MKKLSLVFLLLVGCSTEPVDKTRAYVLPPALKDCKVFRIRGDWQEELFIVRCPNSITSATWETAESCGKNCTRVVSHGTTSE